jgi:hypothetical protein
MVMAAMTAAVMVMMAAMAAVVMVMISSTYILGEIMYVCMHYVRVCIYPSQDKKKSRRKK